MSKKRKIRCPHCGFFETIKWGTRSGYTRYYCKNCGSSFTDRRVWISDKNKFIWFARWVRGKQRICDLASESGYSERTLKRYFYRLLPQCPLWQIQRREKVNLLIDGTYFSNKICLVVYRDHNIKMTLLYRITRSETLRDLKADLKAIHDVGIQIESVTCDGAPNICKMLHRSVSHIKRAIPDLFSYTRYPNVPKSSNSIEAFFGHIKDFGLVDKIHDIYVNNGEICIRQ